MPKYRLLIAYEGTSYLGWQIQANGTTIQGEILKALAILHKEEDLALIGAGRTDTGVHALGQVAHFTSEKIWEPFILQARLNGLLKHDIRILKAQRVDDAFHSQYSATSKVYHYCISYGHCQLPHRRLFSTFIPYSLNIPLLKQATASFKGTHDFTSFTNSAHVGSAAKGAIRTLYRLDLVQDSDNELHLEFEGNGFLYKMVRNITGFLIDIARGVRSINEIETTFAALDRRVSSKAAAPHGLFLMEVKYEGYQTWECADMTH